MKFRKKLLKVEIVLKIKKIGTTLYGIVQILV